MNKLRSTQKKLDPDGKLYLLLDNGAVNAEIIRVIGESFTSWGQANETAILAMVKQLVVDAFDAGKDLGESAEEVENLRAGLEAEENESLRLSSEVERLDELLGSAITALREGHKKLADQLQRERNGG